MGGSSRWSSLQQDSGRRCCRDITASAGAAVGDVGRFSAVVARGGETARLPAVAAPGRGHADAAAVGAAALRVRRACDRGARRETLAGGAAIARHGARRRRTAEPAAAPGRSVERCRTVRGRGAAEHRGRRRRLYHVVGLREVVSGGTRIPLQTTAGKHEQHGHRQHVSTHVWSPCEAIPIRPPARGRLRQGRQPDAFGFRSAAPRDLLRQANNHDHAIRPRSPPARLLASASSAGWPLPPCPAPSRRARRGGPAGGRRTRPAATPDRWRGRAAPSTSRGAR